MTETPQDAREVERREVPTRHHVVAGSAVGVWADAQAERERAHAKHGEKSMESAPWTSEKRLRILLEEVGEVAREFNEADIHDREPDRVALYAELIQVVAMAGAWAEATAVWRHDSVFTPALTTPFTDREQAPLVAERDALQRDLAQAVGERDRLRAGIEALADEEALWDRLDTLNERGVAPELACIDSHDTPFVASLCDMEGAPLVYVHTGDEGRPNGPHDCDECGARDNGWEPTFPVRALIATPDADAQDEGVQR